MKRASVFALFLLLGLTVWLIFLPPGTAADLQSRFLGWFSPVIRSAGEHVPGGGGEQRTLEEVLEENLELRELVGQLQIERAFVDRLREENDHLRRALAFVDQRDHEVVAARVVRRDAVSLWSAAFVDKGSEDGVERDQAVITPAGVVGKITHVAPKLAKVLFLTDERCQISARVAGTSHAGITRGRRGTATTRPEVRLRFLPRLAAVPEGALVVTEGLGGVYPADLVIGTVAGFSSGDTYGEALIVPAVDVAAVQTVYILKTRTDPP